VADLAGYDIQRKPDGGAYSTISTLHGGTLFIDNNVTPGQAYWYQVRATDTSGNSSAYAEIAGAVTPAKVGSVDSALALQGWSHNMVFSATDHDTVAWSSGTITLSSGTTYSIDAGNTGNMAAITYIYLNIAVSVTVLQITTTAGTAAGDGKILIAVAQNVAAGKKAIFQVFGGAGQGVLIVAGNITAATITTNEIAANTIVAGNIHAGTITGTEIAATTITAANIQALTIGAGQIAADAITADKILANAVTGVKINAGAVTTAKLDAGAVTAAKLDIVVGGYNLLINSGINDDDDADGVPDEWTESTAITNLATELDATTKVVGAFCLHCTVSAGDTNGDDADYYQDLTLANVPLAIGDAYALSAYLKADSLVNLRALLLVQWYDVTPALIQTDTIATVTADQGWTRHTGTGTVPATSITARVILRTELTANNGTGQTRFDAIKLERGDVPTTWTTGMVGNVVIDSNRVQVQDSNAKVWLGKRGASLGMWGEDAAGDLQVGWWASGANAGAIVAGAGSILLDAGGIQTPPGAGSYDPTRSFKIVDSGVTYAYLHDYLIGGYNIVELKAEDIAGRQTNIVLNASAPADQVALVAMQVLHADANHGYLKLTSAASTTVADLEMHVQRVWINGTANTGQTIGLTINQGANDDEILSFKSSDVAHGATDLAETDTYGLLAKVEGAAGGLTVQGLKDADGANHSALALVGDLAENANTAKTTAGFGIVSLWGRQISGTGRGNTVADGNVFSIATQRDGSTVSVMLVDEDGDIYHDGTTAPYDAYDDALMAGDLARLMSGQYNKIIEHNRGAFEAAGIIGPQDDHGRFMISTKGVTALTLGALGQLWQEKQQACARLERLERALARIDPRLLEEVVIA